MRRIPILKNNKQILERLQEIFPDTIPNVRYVAVFLDNENFLTTKYCPVDKTINLILELENSDEIHVSSGNCGYLGTGPNTTIEVLNFFNINTTNIENFLFTKSAVKFKVCNNEVMMDSLDFTYIFHQVERKHQDTPEYRNKITLSRNVSVDFQCRKVTLFNPQRHSWNGFINLLSYLKNPEMEYYIGENSPLDDSFYVGKEFMNDLSSSNTPDIRNTNQVCMMLKGSNFKVVCLVDEKYEMQVIDAVHISFKGTPLFQVDEYQIMQAQKSPIKTFLKLIEKRKREELYGSVKLRGDFKK